VKELSEIIEIIRNKWSPACIISLTTARQNDLMHSTNAQIINALVQQQYVDHDKIHLIEHNNMLRDGNPNVDLLNTDLFHLNNKGVSMLAANIKSVIHRVLKIPLPIRSLNFSTELVERDVEDTNKIYLFIMFIVNSTTYNLRVAYKTINKYFDIIK
jgi:hypothetical protein